MIKLDKKKIASAALSLLAAIWLPFSLVFVNGGWLTLGLIQPMYWGIDLLFLLPLLLPLLNLNYRRVPLPKPDIILQIIFCIVWMLLSLLIPNGGDTQESYGSIISKLFRVYFDSQLLITVSYFAFAVLFIVALILLIIIFIRSISFRINATNIRKNYSEKRATIRSQLFTGFTIGFIFALTTLIAQFIVYPFSQNVFELATAITLGIGIGVSLPSSWYLMRRLHHRYNFITSLLAVASVGLLSVGVEAASAYFFGNPFYPGDHPVIDPALRYAIVIGSPILLMPLTFILWGQIMTRIKNIILVGLAIVVGALSLASGLILKYTLTHNEIVESTQTLEQKYKPAIDFKVYDLTYVPGNSPLRSRYSSHEEKVGTILNIKYGGYNEKDGGTSPQIAVYEYNTAQSPIDGGNPNCGQNDILELGDYQLDCQGSETSTGTKVYFSRMSGGEIVAVTITKGSTRIFINTYGDPKFNDHEGLKIAEGLKEVSSDTMTEIDPTY